MFSPSGLFTIVGGKWTTFRSMAMDIMQQVIQHESIRNCTFNTCTHPHTTTTTCTTTTTTCTTHTLQLYGSEEYNSTFDRVLNEFIKELDISQHLNHAYGDQGYLVQKIALEEQLLKRLDPHYPYIEAEGKCCECCECCECSYLITH